MRCPKCGYISFDYLETCRKCNKSIRDTAGDLHGTAYDSAAPPFLQLAAGVRSGDQTAGGIRSAEALPDAQEELEAEEPGALDREFVLDELSFDEPPESEEITVDDDGPAFRLSLDNADGLTLEEDDEAGRESSPPDTARPLPTMDYGDLDISDLAPPPLERASEPMEPVEELEETVPVRAPAFASPVSTVSAGASGLEDLQVNDLNLDAADELTGGEATGQQLTRPVRTGTALDNFQIDLGELFAENKK